MPYSQSVTEPQALEVRFFLLQQLVSRSNKQKLTAVKRLYFPFQFHTLKRSDPEAYACVQFDH